MLLLVVGEATQQPLLGEDFSLTQAVIVIATLIGLDQVSDFLSFRSRRFERVTQSVSVVLVENGRLVEETMKREHVSTDEVLQAARTLQGLENLEEVKFAVLETSGGISIVPWSKA